MAAKKDKEVVFKLIEKYLKVLMEHNIKRSPPETRPQHTPCLIAGGQYLRWFASRMMMDGPDMKKHTP